MIKINVKYKNPDDEEVSKDLYFHMSMRQLTQMEVEAADGLYNMLQALVKSENNAQMLMLFEDIVGKAYGEREDNNPDSFLKSPQITERFMSSMAYDALFTRLVTNSTEMIAFINGLIPKELVAAVEAQGGVEAVIAKAGKTPVEDEGPKLLTDTELVTATGLNHPKDTKGDVVAWAYREPTSAEIQRMNRQQLAEAMQRKSTGWVPTS